MNLRLQYMFLFYPKYRQSSSTQLYFYVVRRPAHRATRQPRNCCPNNLKNILQFRSITFTYDHRLRRPGHPVRSAIHKSQIGRLVVEWVTISEYLLLYVLIFTTQDCHANSSDFPHQSVHCFCLKSSFVSIETMYRQALSFVGFESIAPLLGIRTT